LLQGRARADGIQSLVALATPEFASTLVQRAPDGSLPPQTPELLAKMVPPMFAALQRVLAPLLPDGKLREPGFVQVGSFVWLFVLVLVPSGMVTTCSTCGPAMGDCSVSCGAHYWLEGRVYWRYCLIEMFAALQPVLAPLLPDGTLCEPGFLQVGSVVLCLAA
jgi:hypothetical protein